MYKWLLQYRVLNCQSFLILAKSIFLVLNSQLKYDDLTSESHLIAECAHFVARLFTVGLCADIGVGGLF